MIAAKVIASLLMGAAFGLAATALSFGVGLAILSGRGVDLALDTNHMLLLVLGICMTALWAALGVGFGALIKNQVFAVIGLIAWAFVVDNLLQALVPDAGRFTPVGVSDAFTARFSDYLVHGGGRADPGRLRGRVRCRRRGAVARRDVT